MSRGDLLDKWSAPPSGPESRPRYLLRKVLRHAYWARTEGFHRLVEEDQLDPRERIRVAWAKRQWRRAHGRPPGTGMPIYVVGLQRSGTNMLMRGLDQAPEIEVHNENDKALFDRFRLRSSEVLTKALSSSRHDLIVIKPICDTHDVDRLLDLPGVTAGKALWVYRDVQGRARSEVSKFGPANLLALRDIGAGRGHTRWQGQRLSDESVRLVQSFDLEAMSPHTAAALFWVIRNRLFFDLGLDRRSTVRLVSYDAFARDPESQMRGICDFMGIGYRPEFSAHVSPRQTHGSAALDIDPAVLALADDLFERLEACRLATAQSGSPTSPTSGEHTAQTPSGETP